MKTRQEKIEEQIELQNKIVLLANVNLVNCGSCGSVMFHAVVDIKEDCDIECPFCDFKSEPCDFPDYFYDGLEASEQFEEKPTEKAEVVEDNQSKVLKAVMERYEGFAVLQLALWEDEDVVLVNLADDLNDDLSEEEILEEIRKILR